MVREMATTSPESLKRSETVSSKSALALLARARVLDSGSEFDQVLALSDWLLKSTACLGLEFQAEAHAITARALYESADFSRAADGYRQAIELHRGQSVPAHFEALLGLGLCLDHLGNYTESERLYQQVIKAGAASEAQKIAARRNLVYAAAVRSFACADFAAAQALFAKALTLHPNDDDFRSDILMWLGACHSQLGQFAAAGETYTDLLSSGGAHESVRTQASQCQVFAEGQLHFAARRYQEARSKFEELVKRRGSGNQFRSGAMLMLAHCCFHLSDYRQASRRYRHILKTRNASPDQKREARQWRRAVPGLLERILRSFGSRLGLGVSR